MTGFAPPVWGQTLKRLLVHYAAATIYFAMEDRLKSQEGQNKVGSDLVHKHSRSNSKASTDSNRKSETNASLSSLASHSLGSRSSDSLEESPKSRLGKWHKSVRLGSGTKLFLNRIKTLDKSAEEKVEAKISTTEGKESPGENSISKNSSWTEHVWSTFIHRGYSDDVTEKVSIVTGKELLTDFQQDKFKYFFYHVLDLNTDHVISSEDFQKLNDRIRHYMDWSVNTLQYLALQEVHTIFLDTFLSISASYKCGEYKVGSEWDPFPEAPEPIEKCCVTIEEWLDVWGTLVGEATKINDVPMWLQYYPKTLFDTINRSGSGVISKHELQLFFTAFLDVGKVGEDKIALMTEESFSAMTSNGDVQLDYHIYKLSFLNFLLGRQPNGPGQFIFGMVTPKSGHRLFAVDYSALTKHELDIEKEPFSVDKLSGPGERKSIIV